MLRISSFDEMPYDDALLGELRSISDQLEPGPRRDAFRVMMTFITMDLHRGGVVRRPVIEAVLKELERLTGELDNSEMQKLMTLTGYLPTENERMDHARHDPHKDRWDDCPLCWADVISDEQRDWLMDRGMRGYGNSIAVTCGMTPLWVEGA
jgi:hypothetical protein